MSETLIHHSVAHLRQARSVKQTDGSLKPRGLWVSVQGEDDWRSWCEAEGFALERLACETEVVLDPAARILRLRTCTDLEAFTGRYWKDDPRMRLLSGPDWRRLAREYQGIIIAPYQWSLRLAAHTRWYYGWDCASGCIWDAAAIASLRPRVLA